MIINNVQRYIKDNSLLQSGDNVLVALSGGPDSVCLLHILNELRDYYKLSLGAIHINHMLRGEDATGDEEYAKNLCEKLGIKFYVKRIEIDEISRKEGISHELAGRKERYKAFEEIKKSEGYTRIAIAHNANDQAETILMRLMRGTGLEGLTGIKPSREGGIIRPILCLKREEIESYCSNNNLNPRIDSTNNEKVYNRNKVRLDIIPYMRDNFNEDIVDTLNRMCKLLQSDNEYLEEQSHIMYSEKCTVVKDGLVLNKELFEGEKEAIVTRVIKRAIKVVSNSHENFEMKHIYEIINLAKGTTGKEIHLTNKIIVKNSYGNVILSVRNSNNKNDGNKEVSCVKENIPHEMEFDKAIISCEVIERKNDDKISNNDLIKLFDYDNIKETIVIRNRKDGDKMKPLGVGGTKKLKDIFINLKIPREERDSIPIVCFDEKIAWVVGYKVSQEFRITKDTKKILKITVRRKE